MNTRKFNIAMIGSDANAMNKTGSRLAEPTISLPGFMFRLSSRDTPSDERAYDESQNDNRDPQRGVRGEEQDEVPKPAGEREESDPVTAERGFRHPAELGLLENVRLRLDRKHHLDGRVRNPMFELP